MAVRRASNGRGSAARGGRGKAWPRPAKSGPRAAKSGPRPAKSGPRPAKSGHRTGKAWPRAGKSGPRSGKAWPRFGKTGKTGPHRPWRGAAIRVTPAAAVEPADGKVRLNRFLASAGVCSRRAADELIAQGRISVNGAVQSELGHRVDPIRDEVAVDGERVQPEKRTYVLFNKPKDVVCTSARHEQRERVIDLVHGVRGRLFTVGRLDADSEGLILLTNDGAFAQRMAHPRYGVPKTYAVLVRGRVSDEAVAKARGGVWVAEGRTGGLQVRVERMSPDRTYMKVTLREGKNREIRRVFAKLGHNVLALKRVRIGRLTLHGLRPGDHRFLSRAEVDDLLSLAQEAHEAQEPQKPKENR